ncbi:TetR family transcriptional regulator [Actinomadura rupiterrae]|uniref:TetR family transcriptional regulator n=1 Tax=Actinomadura rupiterrae TaxID=559627 RepID=UPI0020A3B19E|nr:TetR family transcriptional regulator [Actinomadura rupiterrae]MCP2342796.1 AcrR family transcriptional regulator [Actinomadura rupiterrae]
MAYDSAATRERILAAASAEFAEHGVAGARVDRIAANAEANKRAIYDYFGDKNRLFAAVLERLMTDLAAAVPVDGGDLGAYAERLFEYHRDHPEALRLLMWEALELGDGPVPDEEARTAHYLDKAGAAASASGDPGTLMLFTLGLVAWPLAMPQIRRMLLGPDHSLDALRPAIADAVRTLAAREGSAPSAPSAPNAT